MEDKMTDEAVKRRIVDIAGDVNASEQDRSNARMLLVCGIVRAKKILEDAISKDEEGIKR